MKIRDLFVDFLADECGFNPHRIYIDDRPAGHSYVAVNLDDHWSLSFYISNKDAAVSCCLYYKSRFSSMVPVFDSTKLNDPASLDFMKGKILKAKATRFRSKKLG